ncbi:MAG: GDP-mannose 4,6-dehydratase [Thermoguttaceae bacterium]|nr:GDP-mannose 4,6-dehydratase [Thermoguttaceae bacterium]
MKTSLVTGATGQDGSYLIRNLLAKGYRVVGLVRRSSTSNASRLADLVPGVQENGSELIYRYGDLADSSSLIRQLEEFAPDEVYNLGAQSDVRVSFDAPEFTADVDGLGPLRLLEGIRQLGLASKTRFYQASTSELFGDVREKPQRETTPFAPRSPYAAAKLFAYWTTVNYREAYGIFACNGILFNHESPLRGENFVTRKISLGAARIRAGLQETLRMGNLNSRRDWGFAGDYVEGMRLMLQQDEPDDYVLATGEQRSVREFLELIFRKLDYELVWKGSGVDEIGLDRKTGKTLVEIDPFFFRPTEVNYLCGDASKAREKLGWTPKTTFEQLAETMLQNDLALVEREKKARG